MGTQRAARALAVRTEGQHAVQVWLDQLRQPDHHRQVKSLVQARRAKQVPRVDHEINKPEAQERLGRDITVRPRNRLPRGCGCEGQGLEPGRLDHRTHRIVSELIGCEHLPGLDTANPGQQQRRKTVPDHHMLDQRTHRNVRRSQPVPRAGREMTHHSLKLRRCSLDQFHDRTIALGRPRRGCRHTITVNGTSKYRSVVAFVQKRRV